MLTKARLNQLDKTGASCDIETCLMASCLVSP